MVNEVKFTLAMDGGTAVITDLDGVGRKLVDFNTKVKDAGGGADAFGGSMRTVGNQLRGFGGDVDGAKGSVDALAHGMKSAFIGSSVAVGLIGLKNTMIDFTQSMVQAQIQVDQLRNGLNFAVGRNQAAGELNFIRESSKALGLEFVSTSQQYMKLAASARGTSLEGQKARDIFTAVAQASTVMGLSAEQTSGALLSISQMISKNTVMSEELKGQLGERLPGAFQIAARAMGVTTGELNKMLETGQVLAEDFLPKFANELTKNTAPAIEEASKSMQASVNRLSNSWTEFKQVVAESGVSDFFKSDMNIINDALSSTAKKMQMAKAEGDGFLGQFGALTQGVVNFLNPINLVNYQFQDLDKKLIDAQEELKKTTQALEKDPDSGWLKSAAHNTRAYIDMLREAQTRQIQLIGTYESGDERKIKAFNAELSQAKAGKDKATSGYADVLQGLSGVNANFQKHLSQLKAGFDAGIVTQEKYVDDVKALIEKEGGVRKEAAKAQSDAGNTIAASIARANEAALLEIEMGSKVNASDRFRITTLSQISEELRKKNITLERAIALESAMHDVEMNMAQSEAKLKAAKDAADVAKEQEKAITALLDAGQKELDQIDAKIKKQIETNEQIGLTKAQIASLNAERQIQSALADEEYAQAIRNAAVYAGEYKDAYLQYANALDLAAEKRRKLAGLDAVGASKKAADEARKEWEKTADKINDALTDALMRGFESGKGFAESLRDSVVSVFKSMAAIKIRAIVEPVGQAAAGLLGFGGAANAGNTVSGLGNLASIGGAGFQAITGSLAGASAASLGYANAVGTVGGDALGALISANGGWAGVSTMATAGEVGALGSAAGAGAGAMGSITSALASIGPVGWAAIAAGAVLAFQDHGTPAANTGDSSATYGRDGSLLALQTTIGLTQGTTDMAAALQASYLSAAKSLGATLAQVNYNINTNSGRDGANPQTIIDSTVGGRRYSSGEVSSSDSAAMQLAASRAVFSALQGSELPAYLSKMFDGLSAASMSQEQITNTLAYAQSVKQVRDALLETREPMQIMQDTVAEGFAALGTSAERFKTDFVHAIDAGVSPQNLAKWQELQTTMASLADLADKEAKSREAAAKAIQEAVNKEIATATQWADKLAVLMGTTTERQLALNADLATTANAGTQALIRQVYAQEDLQAATTSAKDSLKSFADGLKSLSSEVVSAQSRIEDLQLQAQIQAANDANAAAAKFRNLGKSLRDFLDGETLAPSANFGKLLAKAMGGDGEAMQALPGVATAAINLAKERAANATDFALQKAGVLNQLARAADAADLLAAQTVPVPQAQDPMVTAVQDLQDAIRQLRDGITQSISVDLTNRLGEIDTNLSGSIDRLEFGSYFSGLASDATLQNIFEILDTNNDGQISRLETLKDKGDAQILKLEDVKTNTANTAANAGNTANMVDAMRTVLASKFDTLDSSVNGLLSYGEFSAGFTGLASDAVLRDIFKTLDADGDGQISRLEAIKNATEPLQNTFNLKMEDMTLRMVNATEGIEESVAWSNHELGVIARGVLGEYGGMMVRFARGAGPYQDVYASGGVFTNSVVRGPTSFDMGLMGEAGPEAVMPLVNIGGSLGVRASGGAGDTRRLEALIEKLVADNAQMRAELRAINIHAANTADNTGRMQRNGVLVYTDPAEPLNTVVA